MAPKIDMKDYEQMVRIEHAIMGAIKPYQNGRTEAVLVAFALIRICRTLLNLYPDGEVPGLVAMFVAFLKGEPKEPNASQGAESPLWMPPTNVN